MVSEEGSVETVGVVVGYQSCRGILKDIEKETEKGMFSRDL